MSRYKKEKWCMYWDLTNWWLTGFGIGSGIAPIAVGGIISAIFQDAVCSTNSSNSSSSEQ
jgi:hypothetical protein